MTEQTNLDKRPRVPYSIGTGIPKHGAAEIEGYLQSLRVQGFCVIERVIPEDEVATARDNVLRGRELLLKDRELERRKRIELEHQRNPDAEIDDNPKRLDNWRVDPSLPPQAEICDIARCEVFAEYLGARLAFGLAARFDRLRPQRRTAVEALRGGGATLSRPLHGTIDGLVSWPGGCDPV